MLHGRDVLYVLEERAPGRPPLVTDVGVRLPAHLTASGRAILAHAAGRAGAGALPLAGARSWTGTAPGPTSLSALRTLLTETRQRGYAVEDGEVTPGLASVAAAVLDHNGHPVAGVAVTYAEGDAERRDARRPTTAEPSARPAAHPPHRRPLGPAADVVPPAPLDVAPRDLRQVTTFLGHRRSCGSTARVGGGAARPRWSSAPSRCRRPRAATAGHAAVEDGRDGSSGASRRRPHVDPPGTPPHNHNDPKTKNAVSRAGETGKDVRDPSTS